MNCKILLSIFLSGILFACEQPPVVDYQIIPQPQSIAYTPGVLKLSQKVKIAFPEELTNEAGLLKQYLAADFAMQVETAEKEKQPILYFS